MLTRKPPPCVVTIAGTDPSGGAGIQADIKAISATGSYAASIITALVAQNTQGVQAIHDIPAAFVKQQCTSVFNDLTVQAVKIGMLHREAIIETIAIALEQYPRPHVVFDPVMVAKNGCALIEPNTINYLKQRLLKHCSVITPNLPEAEVLLDRPITTRTGMEAAAQELGDRYTLNVLIKGGHFDAQDASDVLYIQSSGTTHWFHAARIQTKNTHGTGCSLSSAIASFLAQNYTLVDAVSAAKRYLTEAILAGSALHIGHGHGPVDHFYFIKR